MTEKLLTGTKKNQYKFKMNMQMSYGFLLDLMNVLAQGHNAVTPVMLEPAALRSRVKHSTTERLRSLIYGVQIYGTFEIACSVQ